MTYFVLQWAGSGLHGDLKARPSLLDRRGTDSGRREIRRRLGHLIEESGK